MNRIRTLPLLLCVLTALILLSAGCSGKTDPAPSPAPAEPGQETPEEGAALAGDARELGSLRSFTAKTLDGESFTQDDVAARDVTILNFWGITCWPCITEMPDLAEFAKALPDNVRMVTVCLDGPGNEDVARNVLEQAGYEGVALISGDGDFASLCGNLMYTPTTVFADSEGNLAGDAIIGAQAELAEVYLEAVNAVLEADGKAEISLGE